MARPTFYFVWTIGVDDAFKTQAKKIDPNADGMGVRLFPVGSTPGDPVTHLWAHWVLSEGDDGRLIGFLAALSAQGTVGIHNSAAFTRQEVLDIWGLEPWEPAE